jgi:hypothetical protein
MKRWSALEMIARHCRDRSGQLTLNIPEYWIESVVETGALR